jgi:hypothetical protein
VRYEQTETFDEVAKVAKKKKHGRSSMINNAIHGKSSSIFD